MDNIKMTISELCESPGEEAAWSLLENVYDTHQNDLERNFVGLIRSKEHVNLSDVDNIGLRMEIGIGKSASVFSHVHLQTAVELSRQALEYERSPEEVDNTGVYKRRGLIISAITSCMSFLDSAINEFLEITRGTIGRHRSDELAEAGFDETFKKRLEGLENEVINWRHTSTLKKYQALLIMADKEPLDPGTLPYQDVNSVRKLRNYFVHFTPEWFEHDNEDVQTKLGRDLQGKFEPNPFAKEEDPYLSDKIFIYDCVNWCIESVIAFVEKFYSRVGIDSPYTKENSYDYNEYLVA